MIKIDKNIPLPFIRRKYPFKDMQVKESFFVSCTAKELRTIQSVVFANGKRNNRKYITRKENKGLRVWRIK